MSNYSKTTDFEAKDSLPTGDSGKIIRGAEFETEFDAISTAIATKADTAGPTFTGTLTFETISDGTIGVTAFVDEDNMASNSATLVPTQQSVKAYVDSQVTAQDLDFQADTGGALSIDLDSETMTFTGGTGIDTSGLGNAVTFAIDSTVATLTGSQTLTNKTLTSPVLNTGVSGTAVLDEDNMASNSATQLATQQSIKAYVDSQVGANNELSEILANGNTTGGTNIVFGDSASVSDDRLVFGAGSDLQIYHSGVHSYIDDAGTGNLTLRGNASVRVEKYEGEILADFAADGAVSLYHDNSVKIATTSTGVNVTGNVAVSGTVDGRDVATDGTKLDGIEALADVTDTANVTAAGALMDSELTSEASVKALNQGVATTDSPTFAAVTVNGNVEFDGLSGTGAVTVTDILDQDDMSSNSATALATQQSIKAYVDSQVDTVDTLSEVLANGNTTGGTNIAFGDNDKAVFGAGSDLEIYHDGSNSYVKDAGTGNLLIQADNFVVLETTAGINYFQGQSGGASTIYYSGSPKLATTSTGIDVTGTVTADEANIGEFSTSTNVFQGNVGGTGARLRAVVSSNSNPTFSFDTDTDTGMYTAGANTLNFTTGGVQRIRFDSAGNISFYEDTGTTAKLTWSASAETLNFADNGKAVFGAGSDLQIYHDGSNSFINETGTGSLYIGAESEIQLRSYSTNEKFLVGTSNGATSLYYNGVRKLDTTSTGIDVTGTVTADGLTVDGATTFNQGSGESVNIFRSPDYATLRIGVSSADHFYLQEAGSNDLYLAHVNAGVAGYSAKFASNGDISFYEDTGTTAKLFWDASAETVEIAGVGKLGATDGDLNIYSTASNHGGLRLGNGYVGPTNNAGTITDDAISLGLSGQRFTNLYLSDGVSSSGKAGSASVFNEGGTTADFRVESSGNTHMLFVDGGTNKVGIGTSSPAYTLDVDEVGTNSTGTFLLTGGNSASNDYTQTALLKLRGTSINPNQPAHDANSSVAEIRLNHVDLAGNASSGNITFYTNPSNNVNGSLAERMRIDSSGNLLVGKTSADDFGSAGAQIEAGGQITNSVASAPSLRLNRGGTDGDIIELNKAGTTVGSISATGDDLTIGTGDTGIRFVDASDSIQPINTSTGGRRDAAVDIGISSYRFKDLYLSNAVKNASGALAVESGGGGQLLLKASSELTFTANAAERARIDTSGNLLVGKTSTSFTVAGTQIGFDGSIVATRSTNPIITLNRLSSDGEIQRFYKDGTQVGSIGAYAGDLTIGDDDIGIRFDTGAGLVPWDLGATATGGSARDAAIDIGVASARFKDLYLSSSIKLSNSSYDTGSTVTTSVSGDLITGLADTALRFYDGGDAIIPRSTADAARNGTTDLGASNSRFKDLYLSGGVYLGGTGSANHLDDYEEGTFTGAVSDAASGGNESSTVVNGTYVKIGKIVYIQFNVSNIDTTGMTAGNDVHITGLPFTSASVTGNGKYSGTVHMSVVTFEQAPILNLNENQTHIKIQEVRSAAGVDSITVSQLSSGASDFHGNLVYETA